MYYFHAVHIGECLILFLLGPPPGMAGPPPRFNTPPFNSEFYFENKIVNSINIII